MATCVGVVHKLQTVKLTVGDRVYRWMNAEWILLNCWLLCIAKPPTEFILSQNCAS